jgi:hypothetical protein
VPLYQRIGASHSTKWSLIDPFYPKAANGRPPIGLQRMLQEHFLQHWFNLSTEAPR